MEVDVFNASAAVQTPLKGMSPKNSGLEGRGQTGLMLAVEPLVETPALQLLRFVSSGQFQTLPEPQPLHFSDGLILSQRQNELMGVKIYCEQCICEVIINVFVNKLD